MDGITTIFGPKCFQMQDFAYTNTPGLSQKIPWCMDPDTNFSQRSNCSCFTKRALIRRIANPQSAFYRWPQEDFSVTHYERHRQTCCLKFCQTSIRRIVACSVNKRVERLLDRPSATVACVRNLSFLSFIFYYIIQRHVKILLKIL